MRKWKCLYWVYLVTYNVADLPPPDDLTRLLKLDSKELPNLYAVGLQELKHSPGSLLSDAFYDDPWTVKLTECLSKRNYVRVKSVRLMGMHLVVFVRRADLTYIYNIESEVTPTGFKGLWGNKGGVSIRMDISGINVCFVNCHLAAHQNSVSNRIQDYDQILESQEFRNIETKSILDHDYVFWMGDLNFRLDDVPKTEVERRISTGDPDELHSLLSHDQLKKAMEDQLLLVDFEEGDITFLPSYKFNKGTHIYDTSTKQRKPAWCDRILWMVHEDSFYGCELDIQQMSYCSLPEYKDSDHKPVVSEFILQVLAYPAELPVMFEPMGTWLTDKDQKIYYAITKSEYSPSSRDWIGLYKADYQHVYDYTTYVWAGTKADDMGDGSAMYSAEFDKYYIKDLQGLYCLCYFSYKKNCVIGYSDTFRISVVEDCSTDSSEAGFLTDSSDSDRQTRRPKTAARGRKRTNRVAPLPDLDHQ